jgi:hypothetical protein
MDRSPGTPVELQKFSLRHGLQLAEVARFSSPGREKSINSTEQSLQS